MLKIRLMRTGRRNAPQYRFVLIDAHAKRQGQYLEKLGHYDPAGKDESKVAVDLVRVKHWVGLGAQPTESVASLLKTRGLDFTALRTARKIRQRTREKVKKKRKAKEKA